MAIIELVEAQTVAQQAVGEAERARGTKSAPKKAPTGAPRESAEALKDQSPTAAAVAASAQEQTAAAQPEDEQATVADVPETFVEEPAPEAELQAAMAELAEAEAAAEPDAKDEK